MNPIYIYSSFIDDNAITGVSTLPANTSRPYRIRKLDLILLSVMLLILFLVGLGNHPYIVPSEARYIEIPRQMVETGDWVTPRLNGVKYFEKPPLFYWLQAAQIKFFGLGEFSGRFWTAMIMLGLCLLTFVAATKQFGRATGILSALILASCVLGFISSRIAMLDAPVTLFMNLCLFAFIFAATAPPSRKRDGLLALMYSASALAVLTKGLIGFVIPAIVIGGWIVLTNRWKLLLSVRLIPGLILFLLITAPWHIMAGQETPEFYNFYFIHEHFDRFLTDSHERSKPWWFFIVVLIVGFLPWTVFLFQAIFSRIKQAWKDRSDLGFDLFLLLWIALTFLFFSLSSSKLVPYILPIFPPIAIFIARYLVWQYTVTISNGFIRGAYVMSGLFMLMAAAYPVIMLTDSQAISTVAPIMLEAKILTVVLFALSVWIYLCLRLQMTAKKLINVMVICALVFVSAISYVAPLAATRSAQNSTKPYAEYLNKHLTDSDEVAAFIYYPQDLPIYINRNITVVDVFGEMTFGRSIDESTHDRLIDRETFLKRWLAKDHRIYILLRKGDLIEQCPFFCYDPITILNLEGPNILVSNMPAKEEN